MQCGAVFCCVLLCVAVCCCVCVLIALARMGLYYGALYICVAVCCIVLQCVVWCSMLQCVLITHFNLRQATLSSGKCVVSNTGLNSFKNQDIWFKICITTIHWRIKTPHLRIRLEPEGQTYVLWAGPRLINSSWIHELIMNSWLNWWIDD